MTDAVNITHPGQINGAGAVDATFLKLFSGEVLSAFHQEQVTMGKFLERSISSGKSATFPVTGRLKASLHTPGVFIDGQKMLQNERVIPIDGKLLADSQTSDIEELQNHYDIRSIISTELGEAIANVYDQNNLRCAILGSRDTTPLITGETDAGEEIVDADADTVVANLVAAIASSNTKLTVKRIPKSDRNTFLAPVQYALIQQSNLVTNRDLGGIGSFAQGVSGPIQGTSLIETLNLPQVDESADADVIAKYRADYSNVVAVTTHKSAVGIVKLMGMSLEVFWDGRRQVWVLIAKQATGHDWLRNAASCSIVTAASA
mgnify:CR=1 FL=1